MLYMSYIEIMSLIFFFFLNGPGAAQHFLPDLTHQIQLVSS